MRSRAKGEEFGVARSHHHGDDDTARVRLRDRGAEYNSDNRKGKLKGGSIIRLRSKGSAWVGSGIALVIFAFLLLINELSSSSSSRTTIQSSLPGLDATSIDNSHRLGDARVPSKSNGFSCRYDGHCGVSKTCAVAAGGTEGVCEAFASKGSAKSSAAASCLDSCLKELQIDEHWYHEQWPVVEWSEDVVSQGRPDGCLIVYHREPQGDHFNYLDEQDRSEQSEYEGIPSSLVKWVNTRFHHIKRVDPLNDDIRDNRWVALCTAPCVSDADCRTKNDVSVPGFECRENSCLRNPLFWGPEVPTRETPREEMKAAADMVLVTGATIGYLSGLTNLAASARYWAPQYKMVVYNLGGISAEDIAKIRSWSNVIAVEWENGVPDHYPAHVHEGKIYAWKPIIVNETVHKYGSIFWLDSGSTLAGPVQPIQKVLQHQGIALMKGQDLDMRPKAFDKTFEWFGYDKRTMAVGPHFSGNTQAFMYPSRYIDTVVIPNCKCALDPNCITPPGSSLGDHRYDQTTISILAYMPKTRLPHYTEFLAADSQQLNSDMMEPSFKFVWTARNGCDFYSNRDPELNGKPPDGGYFHYIPEDSVALKQQGISNRFQLYHGPDSLEGGEEIPDQHHLVRGASMRIAHNNNGPMKSDADAAVDQGDDRPDVRLQETGDNNELTAMWNNEKLHLMRLEQARRANQQG